MSTVITIIGKPNVGKSTLFNRLTKTQAALVYDLPGTTIDRNYGIVEIAGDFYILIDTAGITGTKLEDILFIKQVEQAINESHIILFLVDAATGITTQDLNLAKKLRKFNRKLILVINKIDGINLDLARADFFKFGFVNFIEISAKYNRGINNLKNALATHVHTDYNVITQLKGEEADEEAKDNCYVDLPIKVAIIGQPNVGKSTLINNILKEDRVIVLDQPGTTRDSIYIPTQFGKDKYVLIDTAGIRKKSKIKDPLEKFSVIKSLQAINDSQVTVLLIDACKGIVEQDLKLIKCIITSGKGLVIAINKWDLIPEREHSKLLKKIKISLEFINFIEPIKISGLYGIGIKKFFHAILKVFKSATEEISTNKLTLLLKEAVSLNQPSIVKGRRIKLRYAHLGGHFPFRIIIHGNQATNVPLHYKRYLSNFYREKLLLNGIVVEIIFKNSNNPYVIND